MSNDVSLKVDARSEEYDEDGGVVSVGGGLGLGGSRERVWLGVNRTRERSGVPGQRTLQPKSADL